MQIQLNRKEHRQMTLQDKINYEFQCFFLDLMRTSKENIFAHSAEIEMKKELLICLQSLAENTDEDEEKVLMLQNNLLESSYCFYKDMSQRSNADSLNETVGKWKDFLIQENTNTKGLRGVP